jgi:hypothetical protein
MVKKGASKFGPGTVLRILVPGEADGVALVTHRHPQFGDLIRVFARRLAAGDVLSPRVVAEESPVLSGFTSVRLGTKQRVYVRCGRVDVPVPLQTFPVFRANGLPDPITNEDAVYLWDGSREWRVAQTAEVRRLPSRFIWSPTAVSELVRVGWTDEQYGFEFFERPLM